MIGDNGRTGDAAKPLVTELHLDSGIRLYVHPMSNDTVILIEQRAAELFPYPDPSPFEEDLPDSAIPGQKLDARRNPEYRRLMAEVDEKRSTWKLFRLRNLSVEFPDFENQQAVIDACRPRLQMMIDDGLIEPPADDAALWDLIFLHCVLLTTDDRFLFNGATLHRFPITEAEIRDSFRVVRADVSREKLHGVVLGAVQRSFRASRADRQPDARDGERVVPGDAPAE